jgi:purine-cytosine permease-like protein
MTVQEGPGAKGTGQPPLGDLVLEALKGIRSEILLYGIAVIVIIVGSAQFGITVLQALEIPLLVFATIVLILYFILAFRAARKKGTGGEGKGVRLRQAGDR